MKPRQGGFTLVELIVSIVIISVAVGGVLLVFTVAVTHSADPMQQQQALAIAEGYLDEILSRPYADPDGGTETSRALFDDVADYDGLVEAPHDQNGAALPDLADYQVQVTVTEQPIGPAGATLPAKRVDVRVTRPPLVDLTISGFRLQ